MAFNVEITDSAVQDAEEYFEYIRGEKRDRVGAERWWNGFVEAVLSLEHQPLRCSIVPESALRNQRLRQLLYHSHRIVFSVSDKSRTVRVLRVYHVRRQQLRSQDIVDL